MNGQSPPLARYKRIIVCADGTWLSSDAGDKSAPSNVAKLARAVATTGLDESGQLMKQIVLYRSGLGSGDLPFQKAIDGGLGWGLDEEVCQVYDFISNNYELGDELFFFGFSRGAFTVRSVAGLICDVGVLSAVHMSRFADMWAAYRANTNGEPFRKSAWYIENHDKIQHGDVPVKVVGVWDTVGALGIPEWPVVTWATKAGIPINKKYAFHNTNVSKNIDYAFQALAIDETRFTFPPTMWHKLDGGPAKELQQCWFPGVHSNIGGATGKGTMDFEEIGQNTFAWMVDNVSRMLTFEDEAINSIINDHMVAMGEIKTPSGWGCGPIVNNYTGALGALYWTLGRKDRTPGAYVQGPAGSDTPDSGATNETFHPITRIRKEKLQAQYSPKALDKFVPEKAKMGGGWTWMKDGVQPVPEYVMRPEKRMMIAYEEGGDVKYRIGESLSRLLCPREILSELDKDNGVSV